MIDLVQILDDADKTIEDQRVYDKLWLSPEMVQFLRNLNEQANP